MKMDFVGLVRGAFQSNFPNGKNTSLDTGNIAVDIPSSVSRYARRIRDAWGKSAKAALSAAAIVSEANESLGVTEYAQLAGVTRLSAGTLSKLQTIHKMRSRFEKSDDALPNSWTVIYKLARLSDANYRCLLDAGKIGPDLTASEIARCLRPCVRSPSEQPGSRPVRQRFRVLATIRVPAALDAESAEHLRSLIRQALDGKDASIEFSVTKGEWRAQMVPQLLNLLRSHLVAYAKATRDLPEDQYKLLDGVAYQHDFKHREGRYPLAPSDPMSIELPTHSFTVHHGQSDRPRFFAHLYANKILTPFSPSDMFAGLGEPECIKLAYDYCRGKSAKERSSARQGLRRIVEAEPANVEHAKKCLDLIDNQGSL